MTKNFIANLLVNQNKKAMIDSIDNTDDIDFLKKELKKQLRENWDRQEDKDNLINYLEDSIKLCQNDIKKLSENYNVYSFEINDVKARLSTYQDILEGKKSYE